MGGNLLGGKESRYRNKMRFSSSAILLSITSCGACSGTPTEAPRGSDKAGRAWAAEEQRRIDDAIHKIEQSSCKRLTDSEHRFDPMTADATVERLVIKPLNDKTARLDEDGGFSKAEGPHQWAIVPPRNPLPPKLIVVVLDMDGTIRKSGG